MTLCECGCGQEANPGKRFVYGHNRCKTPWKPKPDAQLCECGCGEYAKSGNRFITGHNHRGYRKYEIPICSTCGAILNDDNWFPSQKLSLTYICNVCSIAYVKEWKIKNIEKTRKYRNRYAYVNGTLPINENTECAPFLGVHIAEELLCRMFKNVVRMPYSNPGYDFVCSNGYLIDSKSACTYIQSNGTRMWKFSINKNHIADYFILLAFDNRENLTPLHIWMIPGHILNHLSGTGISETTLYRWDEYRLDIDKVVMCCDTMKGANHE